MWMYSKDNLFDSCEQRKEEVKYILEQYDRNKKYSSNK